MNATAAQRLIPLEKWAEQQYGEDAPSIFTLRSWCRDGKILPLPKKHGRRYYVSEQARYINHADPEYAKVARESAKAQ